MIKLEAEIISRKKDDACIYMHLNGVTLGAIDVPAEHVEELMDLLNGTGNMRQALDILPPNKLELLATWFDVQQAKCPEWKDGEFEVQNDLRKMARLSRASRTKKEN